jgi:hypothetical protein
MARLATDTQLLQWLDTEPERLEHYIEKHPNEADRVDVLTTLAPEVASGLSEAVRPPADLSERVRALFTPDPLARETAEVLYDLMGLAWRTTKALFSDQEGQEP